ncbi:MAG: hypothetical protein CML04_07620 [Pseudozobellia sp.]|nr:hypothetical protein [Pseudozobellia sp.]MBG48620.1 hypothetical protein [Pseudozobellia sp.]|tara:strand:- start:513 stop:1118 length:606 start_codon:yes stop_codon:yes gene_type:complete
MKYTFILFIVIIASAIFMESYEVASMKKYKPIKSDSNITTEKAYDQVMQVLIHPRCMNCHPTDNVPKQGDERRPHYFDMARGDNDKGFSATKCATCHQEENNDYSGVPGAPHWALAPASMGWQGLSKTEIAKRLLDPSTNGGKSHEELVEHMTEDELVLWAWEPGIDANGEPREVPPVSEENFKIAVKKWFDEGARIPSEK